MIDFGEVASLSCPKILIYRLGSLGDTLLALPVFHRIRELFPESDITVLTNSPVNLKAPPLAAILENTGTVNRYIEYPVGTRSYRDLSGLRQQIKRQGFNLMIHLTAARGRANSFRDYVFFHWVCSIPRVIGTPFFGGDLAPKSKIAGMHEWEAHRLARRLAPLALLDLEDPKLWDLRLTAGERTAARDLLTSAGISGPSLIVAMGTKRSENDWGVENWQSLLRNLLPDLGHLNLVFVGAAEDSVRAEEMRAHWSGPSANLCGQTSPRVCAAVMEHGRLFVGHDSGPMHLAATVGLPCVAIFSHHNPPGKWFPRGTRNTVFYPPGNCTDDPHPERAILSISVADVAAAIRGRLQQQG